MSKPNALLIFFAAAAMHPAAMPAAEAGPVFRTDVDMVMLGFAITDSQGNYVSGIRPQDVRVLENGVEQSIRSFEGGGTETRSPEERTPTSVFVLFDTSNCMYDIFSREQDSIAAFVRGLPEGDSVAIYTFSRNLTRMARLTTDREYAIGRLRQTVAGDNTALYNSLLLTIRDAAQAPGRKAIIVFSNGPDDASVVSPDDVAQVAQDEGVPIYVISGRRAESMTAQANRAVSRYTGGETYIAKSRDLQNAAFAAIRTDLEKSYVLTYRPTAEDNRYRRIEIQIKGRTGYRIRTRSGYAPHHRRAQREAAAHASE